jgi:hypothetical protein
MRKEIFSREKTGNVGSPGGGDVNGARRHGSNIYRFQYIDSPCRILHFQRIKTFQ